jgi:hypothetical protein
MKTRRKILRVSGELFCKLFQGGGLGDYVVAENPLPEDARIIYVRHNGFADSFDVLIESIEYPLVHPGDEYFIEPLLKLRRQAMPEGSVN